MTGIKAEGVATGKALAASLVLAALIAACLVLLAARPAYAATVTVNSTGDAGDNSPGNGSCFTGVFIQGSGPGFVRECSLRAAMEETNDNDNEATAVVDAIGFGIPGAGPHTISPASSLPEITEAVTIDGYTQPGPPRTP